MTRLEELRAPSGRNGITNEANERDNICEPRLIDVLSNHQKKRNKKNVQTISEVTEMLGVSCADLISSFVCIDASSRSDRRRRCKTVRVRHHADCSAATQMKQLKSLRFGSHCFVSFKIRLFGSWAPWLRAPTAGLPPPQMMPLSPLQQPVFHIRHSLIYLRFIWRVS